jgi:hypothetical protein
VPDYIKSSVEKRHCPNNMFKTKEVAEIYAEKIKK